MARGHFVGLFLRGVARQVLGTGAAMVGELGGGVSTWKRTPERLGPTSVAQRTVVADRYLQLQPFAGYDEAYCRE